MIGLKALFFLSLKIYITVTQLVHCGHVKDNKVLFCWQLLKSQLCLLIKTGRHCRTASHWLAARPVWVFLKEKQSDITGWHQCTVTCNNCQLERCSVLCGCLSGTAWQPCLSVMWRTSVNDISTVGAALYISMTGTDPQKAWTRPISYHVQTAHPAVDSDWRQELILCCAQQALHALCVNQH